MSTGSPFIVLAYIFCSGLYNRSTSYFLLILSV